MGSSRRLALILTEFQDAIDVEVSIKGDQMSIGVFGPRQRLGQDGARKIVDEIVGSLEGAVGALGEGEDF